MEVRLQETRGGDGAIVFYGTNPTNTPVHYIVKDKDKFENLKKSAVHENLVKYEYYRGTWSKYPSGNLGVKKMSKFMQLVKECVIDIESCLKVDNFNKEKQ